MSAASVRSSSARTAALAALAATVALTLGACGDDTTDSGTVTPTGNPTGVSGGASVSSGAASPAAVAGGLTGDDGTGSPAPLASPQSPDDSAKTAAAEPSQQSRLTLTHIRAGRREDGSRVVFEFGGTGTPGYDVAYVDAAQQQGSGRPVEVPGQTRLQVQFEGQTLPTETGLTEVPVGPVGVDPAAGVAGVAYAGQFEGRGQAVIGLDGDKRPFTVFTLSNPTRLVVDIQR